MASQLLPLEFSGTLMGFDDYIWFLKMSPSCMLLSMLSCVLDADGPCSDYSGNHTKLSKILLNGNNICMLIPGGEGPVAAAS
ncbi:U6 snRNA-associated Sm-like protein [Lachnellula occidentalis]|uniref:U6 snRNA-associated Sm-like protein n=1 Tax=Lachnellula occidentalis TaxID=215460 RepID=A0A8H8RMU6_9HELO|nr:U6 snRNA-associated Sm-like protein [Lachnellula occidentalis]